MSSLHAKAQTRLSNNTPLGVEPRGCSPPSMNWRRKTPEVIDVAKRSKRRLQVNTSRDLAVPPVELKVRVNRQRCQGHARCAALAPELFEADEFGEAHEIGDGRVSADLHDKAYLAKANCPESAIDIEER